ncbi:MAG: hypothetical protein E7643_06260 [Ruminococcaceae bacterium]|nr:hypothetical protein [Oscillospiraceae bacterium]
MKKKMKQLLAGFLCAMLLLGASVPVFAEENAKASPFAEGLGFTALGSHPVVKAYRALPRTVEVLLYVPTDLDDRVGVILGNRLTESKDAYLTLEVYEEGVPRITYMDVWGIRYDFCFMNTDVRSDGWVHLSLVHDAEKGEARCYVDGRLSEAVNTDVTDKPFSACHADAAKNPFFVGGDGTEQNANYFKGAIKSLAVFDCVRSDTEIAADAANGVSAEDKALLALYDMTGLLEYEDIPDLSVNRAHATCLQEWFDESLGAYTGDYDFSLAVVGDTQNLVWREAEGQQKYLGATAGLYSWIVDHVESKKIQYVLGLGDIVDNDFDSEWELAKNAIIQMDGVVPYSLIRGHGHDTVTKFNRYFAEHTPFIENIGGTFKEGSVANTWQTFSFGGEDYLIFGFDFGAPDDVLAWADEVVAAHPDHRIIVTTHAYLDKDATTLDRGEISNATVYADDVKYNEDPDKYVPDGRDSTAKFNDGDTIWQKFASKHKNVFMVISGHVIVEDVIINQREGVHGNTVTEILIDAQGMDDAYETYESGVGMVSMFYFDLDRRQVAIEYYSTVKNAYRRLNVIDLDHKHAFEEVSVSSTCQDKGYKANVCECGKEINRVEFALSTKHTYDSDSDADCNICGKIRMIEPEESTEAESIASEPVGTESAEPESESGSESGSVDADADGEENLDSGVPVYVVIGISVGAVVLLGGGIAIGIFARKKK